jgi:Ca2+-binding RTX toxin-like protein
MTTTRSRLRRRLIATLAVSGLAAGGALVANGSVGASAPSTIGRTIVGDNRANDLYGTAGNDRLVGRGGDDDLYGRAGNDVIIPGPGQDDVYAGAGNDRILAADGQHDDISCGPGTDTVVADRIDDVHPNCENVRLVGPTTSPPTGTSPISSAEAGRIAAAHVGGRVDDIERENDYGAYWEVDVYAPQGEYTIYVSAAGQIVRVDGPFRWG